MIGHFVETQPHIYVIFQFLTILRETKKHISWFIDTVHLYEASSK